MNNTENKQQLELAKEVEKFTDGVALIVSAMSYGTEKGQFVLDVLNDGEETADKYCFENSLDDESCGLDLFDEAYSIQTNLQKVYIPYTDKVQIDEIEGVMLGFNRAERGLSNVVRICEENNQLKEELVNFVPSVIDEEFTDFNPFEVYGVSELHNKFKELQQSYFSELKSKIGNEQFTAVEDKIKHYVDSNEQFNVSPRD